MKPALFFAVVFGLIWLLTPMANAADSDPLPTELHADLNGDGRPERITWFKFAETDDEGDFFQVRVLDDDGQLLWESPRVIDTENPLAFGNWHFGFSLPEIAADIDGDGAVELVTPAPQSDVSPTYFRVLRWQNGQFVPARSGILLEFPRGSGHFPWALADQGQGIWISSFQARQPDGSLRVEVFEYLGGASVRKGVANVDLEDGGFQVRSWPKPLAVLSDMPSPEASDPPLDGGVVIYRARLGPSDHFNSAGARLETVAQILRQDRANYYRGMGDEDDGPDPAFQTLEERETMDARRPIPVGSAQAAWREAILYGNPLVEVEVTDLELRVRIVAP